MLATDGNCRRRLAPDSAHLPPTPDGITSVGLQEMLY